MILFFTVLVCAVYARDPFNIPPELRKNFDGNKLILPADHQVGEDLYGNWTKGAITAIIDAFARERLKRVPDSYNDFYEDCTSHSERIGAKAKCFMTIVRKERKMRTRNRHKTLRRVDVILKRKVKSLDDRLQQMRIKKRRSSWLHARESRDMVRRIRRSVSSRSSYSLRDVRGGDTMLATIARHLKNTVETLYGGKKTESMSWRPLVKKLQILRKKTNTKQLLEKMLLKGRKGSYLKQNKTNASKVSHEETPRKRDPFEEKTINNALGVLREGVELSMSMTGQPVEKGRRMRILSPRLTADDANNSDEVSILSPNLTPSSADSEAWLDFIMTSSGATEGIREAVKHMGIDATAQRDEPIQMTEKDVEETLGKKERRKIDVVRKMEKTYTKQQMNSFRDRGFSFMTPYQKKMVYGRSSPYHDPVLMKSTRSMSAKQLETRVLRAITLLASQEEKYGKRMKQDIILSPLLFGVFVDAPLYTGSTVLSPVLFSTFVSSPVLVGPLILSPWVFSPIILSPWALVPIVLSPFAFAPLVLSPVALSVYVLSPGIFSPAILSPILMVPYILSPTAYSPVILSPLVLSPFVMSPTLGSPTILSPLVLSPAVYSDTKNSSLILSPSVLSPPIESKAEGGIVLLSPGI